MIRGISQEDYHADTEHLESALIWQLEGIRVFISREGRKEGRKAELKMSGLPVFFSLHVESSVHSGLKEKI